MSVTKADIERIAALAALEVDENALPELTKQIAGILAYVDQLKDAKLRPEAAPLPHAAEEWAPLRSDEVRADALDRRPKEIAPEFKYGLFIVPAIGRIEEA